MKITSSKPRGQRLFKSTTYKFTNRKGIKIKNKRPLWIEPIGPSWWFNLNSGQWEVGYDSSKRMTTSYYCMKYDGFNDVFSLKAAKRLINNWDVPKGTKFKVSLPFIGYHFIITK